MEISSLEYKDLDICIRFIKDKIKDINEFKDSFKEHCDSGLSYKMIDKYGKISACVMILDRKYFYSLSYYMVRDDIRGNISSLRLYRKTIEGLRDIPIFVHSDDISTFDRMVDRVAGNQYVFRGMKLKGKKRHG